MRDGVDGTLADLVTGERVNTRELLLARIEALPDAPGLEHARALVARQRRDPHPGGRRGRRRPRRRRVARQPLLNAT